MNREADSIGHMRCWEADGTHWLVRAEGNPTVELQGTSMACKAVADKLEYLQAHPVTDEEKTSAMDCRSRGDPSSASQTLFKERQKNAHSGAPGDGSPGSISHLVRPRRGRGRMVVAEQCKRHRCLDDCALVLLALENRDILQTHEIGRTPTGSVATGIGLSDCQTLIGCQHGLCDHLGHCCRRKPRGCRTQRVFG